LEFIVFTFRPYIRTLVRKAAGLNSETQWGWVKAGVRALTLYP
jgi:hypothetical protein